MKYQASEIREIRIILNNRKELTVYTSDNLNVGDKYTYINKGKEITSKIRFTVSSPLFPQA